MHYSDSILINPPELVPYLALFDGEQTGPDGIEHLASVLSRSGFLHDDAFLELRAAKHQGFAEAPVRLPAHAGSAYPEGSAELRHQMNRWMNGGASNSTA